jgi:phosphopentomutase
MKYVGQTGRPFRVGFQEHFRRYAKNKSKFAAHLLENKHSIGHIEDVMDVLHISNKVHFMDTMEKFHIYKETCKDNQINEKTP